MPMTDEKSLLHLVVYNASKGKIDLDDTDDQARFDALRYHELISSLSSYLEGSAFAASGKNWHCVLSALVADHE